MWVIGPGIASKIRSEMKEIEASERNPNPIPSILPEERPSCLSPRNSDCMTEIYSSLLRSVWQDLTSLWSAIKTVVQFPVLVYKKVKGWITNFFSNDPIQEAENTMTEKAHLAGNTSTETVQRFGEKPASVIISYAEIQERLLNNIILNFTTCGQWSDEPYFSVCQVHPIRWTCISCSDRMNTFCNGVSFLVGINRFVKAEWFKRALKVIQFVNAPHNIIDLNNRFTNLFYASEDPLVQRYLYFPIDLYDQLVRKMESLR